MTGNRNKENQEMREKKKSNARNAIAFRAQRRKVWNTTKDDLERREKCEREQTAAANSKRRRI